MSKKIYLSIFSCFVFFGSTPLAWSKIQGLVIHANSYNQDTENETIDLEGNVQVIFKTQHLNCNKARINLRSKVIDAQGQVLVTTPKATIGGVRVLMDYENETGLIYDGYVQSGNVIFDGSLIQKIGEKDYIADNANYTTCTTCPGAWSFSGKRIRAELGGYAYIKNSWLKFGGFPVIPLPYLILPLKSDRQSGLLTPSFETSSTGGLSISEGYFWNISRSADATIFLKNYELRGPKGAIHSRYLLNPEGSGDLSAEIIRDRVFSSTDRYKAFQPEGSTKTNRWFLRYNHYHVLPEGYVHRVGLNNVSDLQYPIDFPEDTGLLGEPAMENKTSISKNTNDQHFSIELNYYKNLLQADPLAGNDDSVHRLPEIQISQKETRIGESNYLLSANFNYISFSRSGFAWDEISDKDTTGKDPQRYISNICGTIDWSNQLTCSKVWDGKYDPEKDLLRTGQRAEFGSSVIRPIQLQNLDLLPKLTYRETQYFFPVGEDRSNVRRYLRTDISARTTFSKIFGDTDSSSGGHRGTRIKHEIQPEISFTTIPWLYHPPHPFFGSNQGLGEPFYRQETVSDLDLNSPYGLQFDYNDRVYNRKLVTIGVINKLTEKTWSGDTASYRQYLTWKLAQTYDAYMAEQRSSNQPWSDLISEFKIYLSQLEVVQTANYFPYQRVTNLQTRVKIFDSEKKDSVEIGHTLSYNISPEKSDVDYKSRTDNISFNLRKNVSWMDLFGKFVYDTNPAEGGKWIPKWAYGAHFKLPGECWYIDFMQYQIAGDNQVSKLEFEFSWDGEQKPNIPETLMRKVSF